VAKTVSPGGKFIRLDGEVNVQRTHFEGLRLVSVDDAERI